MSAVTLIDTAMLDAISASARASARLRVNRNFHPNNEFPAHRLLIGIEPGSYVRPHRHLDPNKSETMTALRGRLGLVIFNEAGELAQTILLDPRGATLGVDIPHGTYHTVLALEPDSIFMEAKAGPYAPPSEGEFAAWAPAEGDPQFGPYLEKLKNLFD
ncbi:MAG: WbuC family cupin fold metalloprotein [Rhodocyclaceae bacterium]|nr:WbuC family cupin fold metalloprotein [Rhodocyclaceae bacterium]